jgi:SAM-dependent methyltransferase
VVPCSSIPRAGISSSSAIFALTDPFPRWAHPHGIRGSGEQRTYPVAADVIVTFVALVVLGMVPERVLDAAAREKIDTDDDARFYSRPRFVQHVDEAFRERLADLYAESLPAGTTVLDLMSSHVSHFPEDVEFERVLGHGMNGEELGANPYLDEFFTRDLNRKVTLPLEDGALDAVTIAVSIQYLQYPERVVAEIARALRPGGVLIVSFSNRCFPTKAIRAWREATMDERAALVERYLRAAGGFDSPEVVREQPGTDPFYAVVARTRSSA